ncbi:MAG TPA: TonB-dependent receptor [Hyphomicrobiaceae bacterium]|nr:TonB-dependent receptor [Hyphomicrobiaceae bacterium]
MKNMKIRRIPLEIGQAFGGPRAMSARCTIALVAAFGCGAALAQDPEPLQAPEVVVSASSPAAQAAQELKAEQARVPGGVTLVETEELQERNVSNVADMLRYVPGVWSTSASGSDATFISIRGSNLDSADYDGNGVMLLQDGLPVTAADGNNHNRFVDPLTARHVIVARGANALTYGATTLGGAIDFVSRTALDSPAVELMLNAGSFGQAQGRLTGGMVSGSFDGLVTVEARQREGYRDHNEQERESVYANGGWQINESVKTRFYFTYVQNNEELPGTLTRGQWEADPEQASADAVLGNYQWNVETWRFANKTTFEIDADSRISVGLSYETQQLYHPIVQSPFFSLLIDTEQRNLGAAVRYDLRVGDHDLLAGITYGQTEVEGGNYGNNGGYQAGLMALVDNSADSAALYVMDRWHFAPRWTAVYGAQAFSGSREVRNVDPATGVATRNPSGDYDSINPRAGLIYHLTPTADLYANISRLYEAPTTYQIDDEASGSNQVLDAMRGTVLELGTRGTRESGGTLWRWEVSGYYGKLRDEILSIDNPAAPGTGDSLTANVDSTIHAGIEALLGASFPLGGGHRIEPLVSLTLNHFRFDGDPYYGDNKLPAAPDYAVRGEVLYRNANGFFAGPTFDFVGERYADFSNTYKVDSYALLGLRAGVARKQWEVYAELRNLTNENYIARTSVMDIAPANAAILSPGEPLSMYAGMTYRF